MKNLFADADVIYAYTRADALRDGELIDVTEWASANTGFLGGFLCPVVLTRALWISIESIPEKLKGSQDIRGRAHDVLWMASLALKRAMKKESQETYFDVILPVTGNPNDLISCYISLHGGDEGEPVVTIGLPEDF